MLFFSHTEYLTPGNLVSSTLWCHLTAWPPPGLHPPDEVLGSLTWTLTAASSLVGLHLFLPALVCAP